MRLKPVLSICVPSRNRQVYFQETIRSLLSNLRTDVEFIFADNSDDPSIMADFMQDILADPRVVYIPPAGKALSMRDNWERTIEAATGDWISFIGDDDYIDVDVAELITRLLDRNPEMEVLAWSRPVYIWPVPRPFPLSVPVDLQTTVVDISRNVMWSRTFLWEGSQTGVPDCPFTIYHCAVSAKLMQRVKARFGGRYFEHPAVDIENAMKILSLAKHLAYSSRPFSIAGICPASNGASVGSLKRIKEIQSNFMSDLGRNLEKDAYLDDFPFPSYLGNSVVIAQAQLWFKQTYTINIKGWEANFAKACAISCRNLIERECYEEAVQDFRAAFSTWKGGRFLTAFQPDDYVERVPTIPYTGRIQTTPGPSGTTTKVAQTSKRMFVAENIGGVTTPGAFFDVLKQMIVPVDQLDIQVAAAVKPQVRVQARGARR